MVPVVPPLYCQLHQTQQALVAQLQCCQLQKAQLVLEGLVVPPMYYQHRQLQLVPVGQLHLCRLLEL